MSQEHEDERAVAERADEPLTHEDALGLLDALEDGELEADEATRVRAHVEGCERCQRVQAALGGSLKQVMTDGEAKSQSELLPGVQRRLRLRSRGKFYGEEKRRGPSPWPLMIASIGVLVALVVSYLLLGHVGVTSTAPSPTASQSSSK